jgi:mRNA-degrading endonuclease RelE of RelBE toxin-antitoxin system
MPFEIVLLPGAITDLCGLKANRRAEVKSSIEIHLKYEPAKTSRSRIKRLSGVGSPEYRLRVGEFRVYYDITEKKVEILAVIAKSQATEWLEQAGGQQ